ncbi:MAG: ABC transporter substrate-binding protein [Pseudonocardia sp.]
MPPFASIDALDAVHDDCTRRRFLTGAAAAGLLTGCSSSPSSPSTTDAAQGAGFPVMIEHRFGVTTIPALPQRVVTIGDEDIAVALGVTPVGAVRNTQTDSGVAPWLEGRIDPATTTLIDIPPGAEGAGATGVNIEQVAALGPDLILAIGHFGLELDYPALSRLAPTVGYATEWGGQSWQEQTLVDARALGVPERGQQAVAETEAAVRAARDARPGLAGKTVTFSYAFAPDQIVTLKSAKDYAVQLLQELGLRIPPSVQQLPDIAPGNPGGALSYENTSLLDSDVVVMLYASDDLQRQVEELGLFGNLRAVRNQRYIVIDLPTATALRSPTVLSVPWALEQIGPALDRVAG